MEYRLEHHLPRKIIVQILENFSHLQNKKYEKNYMKGA